MTMHLLRSAKLGMGAALLLGVPGRADARVFVGLGFGFPYYPPPPTYYAPPPVVYPPPYVARPAMARCLAAGFACPLPYLRPVGAPCSCPDAYGRFFPGRVG